MTATATAPPPASTPTPTSATGTATVGGRRPDRRMLAYAEIALTTLTLAAAAGLGRALADWSFLATVLATGVIAHALAAGCRRLGLGGSATGAVSAVLVVPVVALLHMPATTTLGLPGLATLDEIGRQLAEGWRAFGQVKPPAPVLPGFVLAAAVGVWFVSFSADAAAFRARAQLESIVPAGALFVFGAALDGRRARLPITALFFAAALATWLTQRALDRTSSATWMGHDAAGGGRAMLRAGGALAACAIAAAVLLGPLLPGADADAVVPWRSSDRNNSASRITVSPLVDIKNRITDTADTEVFLVHSPVRSYWRLTSLERFDGRIWSSNRSYGRATGILGADVDTRALDATAEAVTQSYEIQALASIWLPAAFRPLRVRGTDVRYDADSNSLLTQDETVAGATYEVTSAIPHLTPDGLRAVAAEAPASVISTYLALPRDFSSSVTLLARRLVAGKRTQYDRARALQDFFRSGTFVYDLNVPAGHGDRALEEFLFDTHRGYCEQFSGAFAAMARAVGLPARVAVGFTAGEAGADGTLHVRGRNGHAWPEVYFQGYGWVAFEPTPGRGIPGAEQYTAVPEQQASAQDPSSATTLAPTTTAPPPRSDATTTTVAPAPQKDKAQSSDGGRWFELALALVAVLLALPTAWALLITTLRRRRRDRRRAGATTSNARVLVSWAEADEALALGGRGRAPWETPVEFAGKAVSPHQGDGALLQALARATTAAAYGGRELPDDVADEAAAAAARIEEAAEAALDRRGRAKLLFDPRPLLPRRRTRVEVTETAGTR